MAAFISTFTTGFGGVLRERLPELLPGVRIREVYDGLVYYEYDGDYRELREILFFNNTFSVLRAFGKGQLTFPQMVSAAAGKKHRFLLDTGTYRVRFSDKNQFAKVEKQLALKAEKAVSSNSHLKLDRLSPQCEVWYLIRKEGVGFYCQLLHKRETTEKNLNQGELRPEFAYLMCSSVPITPDDTVYDPCCGYGALIKQVSRAFPCRELLASDLDPAKVEALRQGWKGPKARLFCADATALSQVPSGSIDVLLTDPPWGYYEEIEDIGAFYSALLSEFRRILAEGGRAAILSARKEEFRQAAEAAGLPIREEIHTLVNGKKACVFLLQPLQPF